MINEKSIAVLPLDNLSSDKENEYFADGMTEEIINALSKIDDLKVTARTSSFVFKDKKEDVRIIGNQLGVNTVLEGSIRKSGNRIRITVQLIRTDNGFHIWSENFDRQLHDIFELQDEVSLLIADKIREHFGHLRIDEHLVKAPTNNVDAYQIYLKGHFHLKKWNLQDIEKAAHLFEESISRDQSFDLPYYGAGLCYSLLGSWGGQVKDTAFAKAENYLQLGSKIKSDSTYAYHCRATHLFWGLWKDRDAIELLLRAVKIDRNNSEINECMAEVLIARGDFDNALMYIERSLERDPLSPNHYYTRANIFYHQNQYEKALENCERSLEIDPSFALSQHLWLACSILLQNKNDLSKPAYQPGDLPDQVPTLLYSLIYEKPEASLSDIIALAEQISQQRPRILMAWDLFLLAHSVPEKAVQVLSERVNHCMGQLVYFRHEIFLKPIRSYPEFIELASNNFTDIHLAGELEKETQVSRALMTSQEVDYFTQKLEDLMVNQQIYLDTSLTLRSLAEALDTHPNKLSWLLNDKLHKNFNDFINYHRLLAFQQKALDSNNSHLTLLGLAYESGFSSKSVFNDFFRKSTGKTPKAWVREQKT